MDSDYSKNVQNSYILILRLRRFQPQLEEDINMKTIFKPLFISTAMSVLGLCFTISHAATLLPVEENIVESKMIVMTQIFPVTQSNSYRKPEQFGRIFDKPLVRIPLDELPLQNFKQSRKKNEFFELATVFNDKLQQLIASIKFSANNTESVQTKPVTRNAVISKKCSISKTTSKA